MYIDYPGKDQNCSTYSECTIHFKVVTSGYKAMVFLNLIRSIKRLRVGFKKHVLSVTIKSFKFPVSCLEVWKYSFDSFFLWILPFD